jgi:hypothetical protein
MADPVEVAETMISDSSPDAKIKDLSELGDSFKGFAPKPKEGESSSDFEARLLTPKRLTLAAFKETNYFAQNYELFRDMFKGGNASPAAVAAAVAANTTVTPIKAEDRKVADLKTQSELVVLDQTDPRAMKSDISMLKPPVPPISGKFVSKAVINTSAKKMFHKLETTKDVHFKPSYDKKEASLNMLSWLYYLVQEYQGIRVGIQNEYLPNDRTVKTLDDQAGFALRKFLTEQVHPDLLGDLLERFRQMQAPLNLPDVHKYSRNVHFYGLEEEAALIKELMIIENDNLFPIRGWYNFFHLWDSRVLKLRELDPSVMEDKTKVWLDYDFANHRIMMDHDPNYVTKVAGLIESHVFETMKVSKNDDPEVVATLFQTVQFNKNTISMATPAAQDIMKAQGGDIPRMMSVLQQLSRWICAGVDVSMSKPSIATLTGLITMHLFLSRNMLHPKAAILVDNVIARWFLRALPIYIGDVLDEEFAMADNVLLRMLDDPQLWDNSAVAQRQVATMRSFFSNWADNDAPGVFGLMSVNEEPVDKELDNGSRTQSLFHRDFVAHSFTDKAYVAKMGMAPYTQGQRFAEFVGVVEVLGSNVRRWKQLQNTMVGPLVAILQLMRNKIDSIYDLMFNLSLAHRACSLHTLTGEYHPEVNELDGAENSDGKVIRQIFYHFDPAAFTNMFFTVSADGVEQARFDNSFFFKAEGIHHFLSRLGDGLAVAARYLPKPTFKTSEIIEKAFDYVPAHDWRDWLKKNMVERKKEMPFELLQARDYGMKKFTAASRFFQRMSASLLGYSPFIIWTNGFERAVVDKKPAFSPSGAGNNLSKKPYRALLIAKPQPILPTLDFGQLETLVVQGKVNEFRAATDGPIRLDIPVSLTSGPPTGHTMPIIRPTSLSEVMKVDSVYVGYRDGDEDKRELNDEFAFLTTLDFVSPIVPWVDIEPQYPLQKMVHVMTVWSQLDIGTPLHYVPVTRQ